MTSRTRRLWAAGMITYLVALGLNRSLVVVRGHSMSPTLRPGDRLLTLPVPPARLRVGRLVVLREPGDDGHLVVKRLLDLCDGTADVRGDAAEHSTDSRTWGRLPVQRIRRVVVTRLPDQPGRRATTSNSGSSRATSPGDRVP